MGAAALAMAMVLAVGILVPLLSGEDGGTTRIIEIAAADTTAVETTEAVEATPLTTFDEPPPTGSDIFRPGELPPVIAGPRLLWQESDFGGAYVRSLVQYDGTIYALADTPSSNDPGLWASNDGLAWSSLGVAAMLETDSAYMNQLTAGDHGLVAVGWSYDGPVSQYSYGSGKTLVWTSADGRGWSSQELVADLPAPLSKYTKWYVYSSGVATHDGAVVVLGIANQDIDYDAVEADFFPDGLPHTLGLDFDGLYDYGSGPPVKVIGSEELGIPSGRPLWEQSTQTVGWVSRDGGDYESIDLTDIFGNGYVNSLIATPTGFAAVGNRDGGSHDVGTPALWTSRDGVSWSEGPIPVDDAVDSYTLQPWGAGLVALGQTRTGRTALQISDDGITWREAEGAAFETGDGRSIQMFQVAAGPLGVVTFGETYFIAEPVGLIVRSGGRHMIIDQSYADPFVTIVDDSTGDVLFEGEVPDDEVYRFHGEAFTATIEHPESGELLFEYTTDDLTAAQDEAAEQYEDYERGFDQQGMSLLYSLDGERWNRESFDDVFGFNGYGSAVVLEDRVVMTLDRDYGGTRMFVGTLEG